MDDLKNAEHMLDITLTSAHRYLFPVPEVAAAINMAASSVEDGTAQAYLNKKTGAVMIAYICPSCQTHHPLIELHDMGVEALNDNDRYLLPVRGCIPYGAWLDSTKGLMHGIESEWVPGRILIDEQAQHVPFQRVDLSRIYEALEVMAEDFMTGYASLALDRLTGRTAIGHECGESDTVHAMLLVDMPYIEDMRSAAGYEPLGNPFLDIMLNAKGERRH